jgi:flagellar hook protein FlgE
VLHRPGSVIARPDYTNTVQGTIEQSENPLSMAIAGQGFFSVAQARGSANGQVLFDERQFFTRAGDFALNDDGCLVNGSGYYLQGWAVDTAGEPDRTTLVPIRVSELVHNPVATSRIEMSANLPADPGTAPVASQLQVHDSLGRLQTVTLGWTRTAANTWTLAIDAPGATVPAVDSVEVRFAAAAATPVADGTIGEFANATGGVTFAAATAGAPASITFSADFGQGPQAITLNLGAFGQARGVTQYDGDEYTVRNLAQDGVPLGAFSSVAVRDSGDVAINYDNGQSRVVARVPVTTFSDPDRLARLDGQAFMRTVESGKARVADVASSGAGKLTIGAVERSNVDLATELSKLIVAQRACTAHTQIVTAADQLLQDTINMRR